MRWYIARLLVLIKREFRNEKEIILLSVCSIVYCDIVTSCSDDDDEVKYPIDTELAGGYVGNLSVNVDGNQMGTTENQKSQFHSLIRKLTKLHYH